MTVAEAQDLYSSQFDRLQALRQTEPAWLRELRVSAFDQFRREGFPTIRDEEFRFTPVAGIANRAFEPTFDGARSEPVAADLRAQVLVPGLQASEVLFANGRYSPELSSLRTLPKGVRVESLAHVLATEPELIEPYLHRFIKFEMQGFTPLNTAFAVDGAVIILPDNAVVAEPLHLVFLSQGAAPFATHPRVLVVAGRQSQATIVETYAGVGEYFTNAVTEFIAAEGSHIDHYRVQRESLSASHISSMHVHLDRAATFSSHAIILGGGLARNDVNAVLDGEGINCTLNGLYLVDGKRLVDTHTTIDHAKPHCESHELYKGILDQQGRGVFNGKIFVRQDAQKTDAKQTNKVLLLSDEATINTKPQLEIFADDVKCTHGATIGQLSAEQMFYLRARGIGKAEAQAILIHAFASDIVERIQVEPLRDQLEQVLLSRLPLEA